MGGSVVFSYAAPPGPATRNQGRGDEAGAGPIAEQPLVGIPRSAPALTFPLPPASDPTEDGLGVLGSRRSGSGVLGSRRVGFGTRVGREGWRCGVR